MGKVFSWSIEVLFVAHCFSTGFSIMRFNRPERNLNNGSFLPPHQNFFGKFTENIGTKRQNRTRNLQFLIWNKGNILGSRYELRSLYFPIWSHTMLIEKLTASFSVRENYSNMITVKMCDKRKTTPIEVNLLSEKDFTFNLATLKNFWWWGTEKILTNTV